jgi:GT2 family glycosyltransferase
LNTTVILPVFNAYEPLAACLRSIDRESPNVPVLLVNDASTDERVAPLLESWTNGRSTRQLLSNERNRGFVHSVNRGMSETGGNVILLNSDTLVTPGWFDALTACLETNDSIATATPWSNNGEIASFPDFCVAAEIPPDPACIARAIYSAGKPEYPGLPTAVGFCMAVSRSALDQAGLFDEEAFGRGYGEENDFCMRVAAIGMRNVLCDNAYVAHRGGSSFSELGLQPDAGSMSRLLAKHPGYLEQVEDFIRADPLKARRLQLLNAVQRNCAGIR